MNSYKNIILQALQEDIGNGDYSSMASIPEGTMGKAKLLVKQTGIIAGVNVALEVLNLVDSAINTTVFIGDGTAIKPGDIVLMASGSVHSLLKAERTLLNFIQRMSGIATMTHQYTELLKGTRTQILDTRKTTPGLRLLEKEAVRIGGGVNHRIGLYDMIMLKDNHIDYAGGITAAVTKTKTYLKTHGLNLKIEVETRNLEEVKEALSCDVDRIMLDNYTPEQIREALKIINGRCETEASGGITLQTVRRYAETGVDFISVGEITHHIQSLDLSFKAINQ